MENLDNEKIEKILEKIIGDTYTKIEIKVGSEKIIKVDNEVIDLTNNSEANNLIMKIIGYFNDQNLSRLEKSELNHELKADFTNNSSLHFTTSDPVMYNQVLNSLNMQKLKYLSEMQMDKILYNVKDLTLNLYATESSYSSVLARDINGNMKEVMDADNLMYDEINVNLCSTSSSTYNDDFNYIETLINKLVNANIETLHNEATFSEANGVYTIVAGNFRLNIHNEELYRRIINMLDMKLDFGRTLED